MGILTGALFAGSRAVNGLSKSLSSSMASRGMPSVSGDAGLGRGVGPGQALVVDPYTWSYSGGMYVEKPKTMSYSVLRYLSKRDPLVASIILTRLRQVRSFASVRTRDETEKSVGRGFRIRLRDGASIKRTKAVVKREDEINTMFSRCARSDVKPEDIQERDFATFLWRFTKDRLVFDQATAEIVLDKKGMLSQFYAIDGATVRVIRPGIGVPKEAKYVQVYNGRPVTVFADKQIAFCPENVSTELSSFGYGEAELEFAMKSVMTLLGISISNEKLFSPGAMAKGAFIAKNAELSQEELRALEMKFRVDASGPRAHHRVPFLGLPKGGELTFVRLPQAVEMEYSKLVDFLVNMICALYGMDPVEVNFPSRGGPGMSGGQLSSANEEARITESKDKGLRPLLSYLERSINLEIMPQVESDGEFEFGFVGFDSKSDSDRADLAKKQVEIFKTVNEVREEQGLDPLEGGDIILSPVWLQAKQAQEAQGEGPGGDQETGQPDDDGNTDENNEGAVNGGTQWKEWIGQRDGGNQGGQW